jgi:hypothetical protein
MPRNDHDKEMFGFGRAADGPLVRRIIMGLSSSDATAMVCGGLSGLQTPHLPQAKMSRRPNLTSSLWRCLTPSHPEQPLSPDERDCELCGDPPGFHSARYRDRADHN